MLVVSTEASLRNHDPPVLLLLVVGSYLLTMLKSASCRGSICAVLLTLVLGRAVVALRCRRLLLGVARLLIARLLVATLLIATLLVAALLTVLLLGRGVLLIVLIVGIVGARHDIE